MPSEEGIDQTSRSLASYEIVIPTEVLEPLVEQLFREQLRPGGYEEHIHCLGILRDRWYERGADSPPTIEDPPAALVNRLRDTGYALRPASWAPEPDEDGSRTDPATGRTIAMHLVRVTPLDQIEVEVETVYYRHGLAAGGAVQKYILGPEGWEPDPCNDGTSWEA